MVLLHRPWAGEAKLGLAEPAGLIGGSPGGPQTRCLGAGHSGTGLKSWSAWCGAGTLRWSGRSARCVSSQLGTGGQLSCGGGFLVTSVQAPAPASVWPALLPQACGSFLFFPRKLFQCSCRSRCPGRRSGYHSVRGHLELNYQCVTGSSVDRYDLFPVFDDYK